MKKLTRRQFIKKARAIHGKKYNYSKVNYITNKINVTIICPLHGEFQQTPNSHLDNKECYKCGTIKTKNGLQSNTEKFVEKAKKIHGDRYDYSKSIYRQARKKLDILCRKHGLFRQIPNDHLNGKGCPRCNYSKGEAILESIFNKHNIICISQWKFPDEKYRFEYDFYLPEYNLLIEFHGRQHYEFVPYFHKTYNVFEEQRMRDKWKLTLAKEKGIPLLEFNHKELNMLSREQFEQLVISKIKH